VPFYNEGSDNNTAVNGAAVLKIAEIDLQFVGPQSEELANNVALWPLRADVQEQFRAVHGAIMNDEYDAVSAPFYQNGNNNVLSWNTTIRVLWYSILDTDQGRMPGLSFDGDIKKQL